MGFQVRPERVGRRQSVASGIVVAIAGLAVVVLGLLASNGGLSKPGPGAAAISPDSRASAATARPAGATPGPGASPGSLPGNLSGATTVACNDAVAARCRQIVKATLEQLAGIDAVPAGVDGPPVKIDVWTSLLCRDTFDCPIGRLLNTEPLGGAIVFYGPGRPVAWLNVVEPSQDPGGGPLRLDPFAWVIRFSL